MYLRTQEKIRYIRQAQRQRISTGWDGKSNPSSVLTFASPKLQEITRRIFMIYYYEDRMFRDKSREWIEASLDRIGAIDTCILELEI